MTIAAGEIITGDALSALRKLPAEYVQVCVTSPPYWALRDYRNEPLQWPDGWEGHYGTEPTIAQYIEHTLMITREIRRVLKPSGVLAWNIDDSHGDETSLYLIPERVAVALQEDGWTVFSLVRWVKPNPMPESMAGWRWERCRVKGASSLVSEWQDCPGCPKCEPHGGYVLRCGNWRPTSSYETIILAAKGNPRYGDGEAVRVGYTEPLNRWGG